MIQGSASSLTKPLGHEAFMKTDYFLWQSHAMIHQEQRPAQV